ncbi:MAG TPA: aminopeptidase [Myxococcaceae bacterium]|nr:aminopeptidase [Myxococcaceae bacterium]
MKHLLLLPFLAMALSGCGGVRYLSQAAGGQLSLFQRARPLRRVLRDDQTPKRLRGLLREVTVIKRFGEAHGLKPTPNYASYVQLDQPAVVWVVSACDPLEFKSRVWSFPVVGDFPYLGWFSLQDARGFGSELQAEGLDVDVRGASAYSTLGWFSDPLLSSMVSDGDEALGELANTVLHESVHATLHIPSQAYFNESLASFVADHLTPEFLERRRGPKSPERDAYVQGEALGRERVRALHEAYDQLDQLYRSSKTREEKLAEKQRLIQELKDRLKLRRDPNNAMLVQYRTYDTGAPEFEALAQACGGSWVRFLETLSVLTTDSFPGPHARDLGPALRPLIERGCPAPPPGTGTVLAAAAAPASN